MFLKNAKLSNNRLSPWSLILSEFDLKVSHIPGKANKSADFLSRKIDPVQDVDVYPCFMVIDYSEVNAPISQVIREGRRLLHN